MRATKRLGDAPRLILETPWTAKKCDFVAYIVKKSTFLRIRIQDSVRAPSGTLPSLVKLENQTRKGAPRGGPRTMVFAQNTVIYRCSDDFMIFVFSINIFHNQYSSLNTCVSKFIFSVVPSRYLDSNTPPKVVISLQTSFKNHISHLPHL